MFQSILATVGIITIIEKGYGYVYDYYHNIERTKYYCNIKRGKDYSKNYIPEPDIIIELNNIPKNIDMSNDRDSDFTEDAVNYQIFTDN